MERVVHVPVEVNRDPRSAEWPALLQLLAHQHNTGRIHTRDLLGVCQQLDAVIVAFTRAVTGR